MEILVTALIMGVFAALALYIWDLRARLSLVEALNKLERTAVDLAIESYEDEIKRLHALIEELTPISV
jgi:hypothetical protein